MSLPADLLALLNACRADPVSDLPRLVLADWLDEHDDPARAEFLRVQCELARPSLDTERIAALKLRERALIDANWRAWAGGLHEVCCDLIDAESRAQYEAAMAEGNRARRGYALSRSEPIHRDDPFHPRLPWKLTRGLLQLITTPQRLDTLALRRWSRGDEIGWLEAVRLPLTVDWAQQLNAGLHVPSGLLRHLSIDVVARQHGDGINHDHHIGGQVVSVREPSINNISRALECVHWKRVAYLQLDDVESCSSFRAIMATANLSRLRSLVLRGRGGLGLSSLLSRQKLTRLVSLDVSATSLPPETLLAFAKRTPRLNILSAWRTPLGDRGFAALVASSWGETLHTLEVMDCDLGDSAMTSLVRSGLLGRLYGPQLNLSMNRIADAGLATLAGSEDLLRFGELVLRENRVGDAGVEALAASPFAANLRYLDLWKNRLTDRAAVALAQSPHLGQLRDLNVRDNSLTDVGRAVLAERYGAVAKVGF